MRAHPLPLPLPSCAEHSLLIHLMLLISALVLAMLSDHGMKKATELLKWTIKKQLFYLGYTTKP